MKTRRAIELWASLGMTLVLVVSGLVTVQAVADSGNGQARDVGAPPLDPGGNNTVGPWSPPAPDNKPAPKGSGKDAGITPAATIAPGPINPGPLLPGVKVGELTATITYDKLGSSDGSGRVVKESPHPVPNSYKAATGYFRGMLAPNIVKIHYAKIDVENGWDYVWIGRSDASVFSPKLTGVYQNYWLSTTTNWGLSETPYTWIQTDSSVQSWGYEADQFAGVWTNPSLATRINSRISIGSYANNEDVRWSLGVRGASQLCLHFSVINVELNHDYVTVTPSSAPSYRYTGSHPNGEYFCGAGSTTEVKLTSDGSGTSTGFTIDYVDLVWGYGGYYSGYGPRDSTGDSWVPTVNRGVFAVAGSPRVYNDATTFAEMDRTSSAGKRIKVAAYSPELPTPYTECDPWYGGRCRFHEFYVSGVEFKLQIHSGSGPIHVSNVYRDESSNPVDNSQWKATWSISLGIGFSLAGLQAGFGVNFGPETPKRSVQTSFSSDLHEARVYIPINPYSGYGTSASNAVGVIFALTGDDVTPSGEGFYDFRVLARLEIEDEFIWLDTGLYGHSYYSQYMSRWDASSQLSGSTRGWAPGYIDYGRDSNHFVNREYRVVDLTMSGWRDNFGTNGWQEMDNRHAYFTTNEAGSDAVSWIKLAGNLASAHTVYFRYMVWNGAAWSAPFLTSSMTTAVRPSGGYYQPSGTWVWSQPTLTSYKVDVTIDGTTQVIASMVFMLDSS